LGWLSDRTKTRRGHFLGGLAILAGATIMLHLGRSVALLIIGRLLQGASAAVVWIVGFALLADTVKKDEIGHYISYVYLGMSLGILLGPVLGGIIFDKLGYNAVFVMMYICIAVDIILRLLVIEKSTAKKWLAPVADQIQLTEPGADQTGVLTEENEQQQPVQERNPNHSMFLLLRSPSFLISLWGTVVLAILVTSMDAVLPIYVKETFKWSSLSVGKWMWCISSFLLMFD
jgi:MFS family permease